MDGNVLDPPPPKPLDADAMYLIFCDWCLVVFAGIFGGVAVLLHVTWVQALIGASLLLTSAIAGAVALRVSRRKRDALAGSWITTILAAFWGALLWWYCATAHFNGDGSEAGAIGIVTLLFAGRAAFLLMSRPGILSSESEE